MLNAIFSFNGKINRLQYFSRIASVGFGVGMLFVIAILTGAIGLYAGGAKPASRMPVLFLLAAASVGLCLWSSLSLQVRRFRDIGWNPLYVIPAWIGADVVARLFHRADSTSPIAAYLHPSPIVGLINLAMAGCLLFWPGRPDGDASEPRDVAHTTEAPRPTSRTAAPNATAPKTVAPVFRLPPAAAAWDGQPRSVFGRRKL